MKKFIKDSGMFYGVVALVDLLLFARPSTMGKLTAAQVNEVGMLYGFFMIATVFLGVAFFIRTLGYTKIKAGTIKNLADNRFNKTRNLDAMLSFVGVLIFLGGYLYQIPKVCKAFNSGFFTILLGSTPLKFVMLGLVILGICVLYGTVAAKMEEYFLPTRRRVKKHVELSPTEFVRNFYPHIPLVIAFLFLFKYMVDMLALR